MAQGTHVKVAILDADAAYGVTLKSMLNSAPGGHLAAVNLNIPDAASQWAEDAPDVVLLDITSSDVSPFELIRQIMSQWPAAALLVLTERQDEASILSSLQAGASGYLLKETPFSRICEAIDEVRAKGCPMSPLVARRLTAWFHKRETTVPPTVELTAREHEILEHLAEDRKNSEIANALSLAEATVRAHLRRIYEKLNVRSRAQAVARMKKNPKK